MHILFITAYDLSAHQGGGATYTRCLIELMQSPPLRARVDHLWPKRKRPDRKGLDHKLRQLSATAGSLFSTMPAKALFDRLSPIAATVKRRLSDTAYDLIVVNGSDNLGILPNPPPDIPVALIFHNIEHDLYAARIDALSPALLPVKPLLQRDFRKFERYETEGMKRVENIISISATDSAFIRALNPDANMVVVPPVFSYAPYRREPPKAHDGPLNIGYMAKYGWWPNREGIIWFVDNVLPALDGKVRLHLFGQGSENAVGPHPQIVTHGFVEDMADIWTACDFMICPIFSGSGVNVKFAEGLYNAMPVLATPFAARGINLTDHPSVILLEGAEEWITFLRAPAARQLAQTAVSEDVSRTFALDSYTQPIRDFVERAVRSHQA